MTTLPPISEQPSAPAPPKECKTPQCTNPCMQGRRWCRQCFNQSRSTKAIEASATYDVQADLDDLRQELRQLIDEYNAHVDTMTAWIEWFQQQVTPPPGK